MNAAGYRAWRQKRTFVLRALYSLAYWLKLVTWYILAGRVYQAIYLHFKVVHTDTPSIKKKKEMTGQIKAFSPDKLNGVLTGRLEGFLFTKLQ